MSRVIVLNGTGSVGKSSTARALQAITAEPFLHAAMDAFLEMLPLRMIGHPDGMIFETIQEEGKPSVVIHSGAVLQRTLTGMRRAMAALAAAGNNLIIDDVMFGEGEAQDYRALMASVDLKFVALTAPLEMIEARELARGDREIGLGRWQYERVHVGVAYDLVIDTAKTTPEENARMIAEAFGL